MSDNKITVSENNNELIFKLFGRIDSSNVSDIESYINKAINNLSFDRVYFDMLELDYISSAGLRLFLKFTKAHPGTSYINLKPEVYEIFEITGFSKILDVKRVMRSVVTNGLEIIGRGGNGTIYRIDDDTILKAYTDKTSLADIEKERKYAQSALISGLPTAIAFDIVKTDENYGLIFEMIKADTFAQRIKDNDESFEIYCDAFAGLFKNIHETNADTDLIPCAKDMYKEYIEELKKYYTDEEIRSLNEFIEALPDKNTLVHNDFHCQNVMMQDDEMLIIDMAELSYGHPLLDLGATGFCLWYTSNYSPESLARFVGIEPVQALALWDRILDVTFNNPTENKKAELQKMIEGFIYFKLAISPICFKNMPKKNIEYHISLARKYFFPNIKHTLELMWDNEDFFE